jgi:hypothetical protein
MVDARPGPLRGGLARDYRSDPTDLDNEILTAFLAALERRVDLAEDRLYSKLCWAGFRARYADADVVFIENVSEERGFARICRTATRTCCWPARSRSK